MNTRFSLVPLIAGFFLLGSHAALAEGDAANGEKIFKKCVACHSLEAGKKKVGPSLNGLFGRTAGTVEDFKYSDGMKESGIVWDEETLNTFLTKPKDVVPKTRMAFPGLKDEQDRLDVIAYLKEATQ
ncbi:MAG TPA: cytochrome c family protein [Kiloniellales bacterium]